MARRWTVAITGVLGVSAAVVLWNYVSVYRPVAQAISSDQRNKGIDVIVHYQWLLNPSVLVFDLRDVSGDKSAADVTRALLQSSNSLKHKKADKVVLSFRGTARFSLKGDYFQTLGMEYGLQNPVYTMRTLPENVLTVDGKRAFGSWTGGFISVTGKQLEDLNAFHQRWFLKDLAGEVSN